MNNTFQLISVIVFIAIALIAVLVFSGILPGYGGSGSSGVRVSATMWGVFPSYKMDKFLTELKTKNKNLDIKYTEKKSENYEIELVNALASGKGPDIFLLPQNWIIKHKDKIWQIPFKNFPEIDFKNIFIDQGELFLDRKNQNVVALPFIIDPLVMYYNKDLMKSAGIVQIPQTWDKFIVDSEKLTIKDESRNLEQSGSALGEYINVNNAKEILSALFLQTGNPIVDTNLKVTLGERIRGEDINSSESALRFYTEFANYEKTSYSWNKFLENSKTAFLKGKLAIYFGMASEFQELREKNPHLNFDVAVFPQTVDSRTRSVYGNMWGLAISNFSPSKEKTFIAASRLVSNESVKILSESFFLPPVRRDVLAEGAEDPVLNIFYKSALLSGGWLDPEPERTSLIFKNMIELVNKKERNLGQALNDAKNELESLMPNKL